MLTTRTTLLSSPRVFSGYPLSHTLTPSTPQASEGVLTRAPHSLERILSQVSPLRGENPRGRRAALVLEVFSHLQPSDAESEV